MKNSLNLRPAQSVTAAKQAAFMPMSSLRVAMLAVLAVVGSAGSALAQAQDAPTVKAKQADAQGLWLTVENPAQKTMQVKVVALNDGTCLSNEVNQKSSYGCQLNFRNLPAGPYAVLLRVGREQYRYNVQVQAQAQTTISVPGLTAPQADSMVASAAR